MPGAFLRRFDNPVVRHNRVMITCFMKTGAQGRQSAPFVRRAEETGVRQTSRNGTSGDMPEFQRKVKQCKPRKLYLPIKSVGRGQTSTRRSDRTGSTVRSDVAGQIMYCDTARSFNSRINHLFFGRCYKG